MDDSGFPKPPEDLDISPDVMELIEQGIESGTFRLFILSCENCGNVLRRAEHWGANKTVYCPVCSLSYGEKWAMKRSIGK